MPSEPGFTLGNVLWVLGFFATIGAVGYAYNWWQAADERQKRRAAERAGVGFAGLWWIVFALVWGALIVGWLLGLLG